MVFTIVCPAQKAVLYNFKFDVPDDFRRQIQKYDENGRKMYRDQGGERVPDTFAESLSKKEVNLICESAAEFLKQKHGYSEVEILYPKSGWVSSGRLHSFPQRSLKKAIKKHPAEAYINVEIDIKNREPAFQWSDLQDQNTERVMFINMHSNYTVSDNSEATIYQETKTFTNELDQIFEENYATDFDEDGRYKLWKPYFTKTDIMRIYELVEEHYDPLPKSANR
jgi:hypothetical protein